MKTKILMLTVLLFGGLLFTSCQKDDALLEDTATEQSYIKDNFIQDEQQGSVLGYNLHNYPDPFNSTTTIEYYLPCCTFVNLSVYQSDISQLSDMILVNGRQEMGIHTFEFDASELPDGVYFVELKVGNKVCRETMTKDSDIDYIVPDER